MVVAVILVLLVLAAPAAAKQDVRAVLSAPVDLAAAPGEPMAVTWRLEDGQGRPFGAGGVVVRLRGALGSTSADVSGAGRYAARVAVPPGGVQRLEFGLRGRRTVAGHTSRADLTFPLTGAVELLLPGWPGVPGALQLIAAAIDAQADMRSP